MCFGSCVDGCLSGVSGGVGVVFYVDFVVVVFGDLIDLVEFIGGGGDGVGDSFEGCGEELCCFVGCGGCCWYVCIWCFGGDGWGVLVCFDGVFVVFGCVGGSSL